MLTPSLLAIGLFVYGFILWTDLSLRSRSSKILPVNTCGGTEAHQRLWATPNWYKALENLAIFGSLYIIISLRARPAAGDPDRPEDPRRRHVPPDLPLPAGAVLHRHRHGLEVVSQPRASASQKTVHDWGWASFSFDWITSTDMAIYYRGDRRRLAGLRLRDGDVPGRPARRRRRHPQARRRSTAPPPINTYRRIVIPLLRPIFLSAFIMLAHLAIKSYDLSGGADRRRPRRRDRAARRPSCIPSPSPATRWRWARASAVMMLTIIARRHRSLSLSRAAGRSDQR